jgi:mannan endo-1,4-beta-mannosidase
MNRTILALGLIAATGCTHGSSGNGGSAPATAIAPTTAAPNTPAPPPPPVTASPVPVVVSPPAPAPAPPPPPFVRVDASSARFTLGGKPFFFAGTNAYYLEQEQAYGSSVTTDALDAAQALGFTVVRTWGFNNNRSTTTTDPSILQVSPGVYQDSGWKAYDFVVSEAGKRGLHLIVNLVNNWDDYGGMNLYVQWAGLTGHDLFYTDPGVRQLYKNYVRDFVSHVNTITGVAYKDDPTIFGWELANEARCESDPGANKGTIIGWYAEMSTYLKSVDPNHLVATGEEGLDVTTTGYTPFTSYTLYFDFYMWLEGTSFTKNTALPSIDWASLHLYPDTWSWLAPESDGKAWILDHTNLAGPLGKPLLLGEYGLETSSHSIYASWLATVAGSNAAGALLWELVPASRSAQAPETTNVVDPTDAVDVATQAAAAATMNAK